jgi:hypothetical protein
LLADNIASQAPLRPSAQPSATPKLLVLNDARPEELFSAPSLVGAPAALPLDFPPAQPSSSPLLALLAPSSSPSLPQIANLVAGPAELPAPREAVAAAVPAAQPAPQLPAAPAVPPEPSSGHYLAVLTPDISDSEKYLSDLTSSDAALAKNAATLNRVNSYLRWMKSALEPVESYLSSTAGLASAQKAELQAAATATTAELGVLLDQRQSLIEQREKLLADRGRLRTGIEGEPLRRSTAKLDTLLGRPIEVSKLFAFFSPFQKNL